MGVLQCNDVLFLEFSIFKEILTAFDTLCEENISCGCNCYYMRVLAERLE